MLKVVVFIVVCAALGLLLLIAAVRRVLRGKIVSGVLLGALGVLLQVLPACIGLIAANLVTYERLTHDQSALTVAFARTGEHQFQALLTFPGGESQRVVLSGDEWQVDARIVKWRSFANIIGFNAAYRLERISGRYGDIENERHAAHTIYPLGVPPRFDVWALLRRYSDWLPWVDALYGSAAYEPMADKAAFQVSVSQSGLIVRPLNEAARQAVGGWR